MEQEKSYDGDRLLRLKEVLHHIPIGAASWWVGVKEGRFPQPLKLGPRTTCWRYSDIMRLVEKGINDDLQGD